MRAPNVFKLLCAAVFLSDLVTSARILSINHVPAYSHYHLGDILYKELAARGHEITFITPFESTTPVENIREVSLKSLDKEFEGIKTNFFNNLDTSLAVKIIWMDAMGIFFDELVLKNENVQKLLKSDEQFDLVIYENFMNEVFAGFAHRFNAPYVLLSTIGSSRWTNSKMGNPNNPSYVPDHLLSFNSKMNFCERMYNTLVYLASELFTHLYTYRKQNELLQKYFPGAPHLNDLLYNASLMLLNSHPSIGAPVPLVPNMIEIGGYHVKPPKPLPKDLQDYLDGAKDGAIYFSMGSNMKSVDIPEKTRNAILESFGKLKLKVLWKWEDDVLPGKPANVKLGKWLPQNDILAHPNIKLFITHGGLLSTIEAIFHGVPVLGIPVFGDQELNVGQAQSAGYGLGVPYRDLTETSLTSTLKEMLTNPKYTKNARHRSKVLHDQQTKPLDRAIYWIEYVIRHKGAPHLKTAALDLSWYQLLLLDVIGAWVIGGIILVCVLRKIVKLLCCRTCSKKVTKDKKRN